MAGTLGDSGFGLQMAGGPNCQVNINVTANPSTIPGVQAPVGTIAYDVVNGIYYVKYGTAATAWQAITGTNSLPKVTLIAGNYADVTQTTVNGSFTFQPQSKMAFLQLVAHGGGGGSGSFDVAGGIRSGGAGGAGGGCSTMHINLAAAPTRTIDYSLTPGGIGGPASVGGVGQNGVSSTGQPTVNFTGGRQIMYALQGTAGAGGTLLGAPSGGTAGQGTCGTGGAGGAGSIGAAAGSVGGGSIPSTSCMGGGGGGGLSALNAEMAGGSGGLTSFTGFGYSNAGAVRTGGGPPNSSVAGLTAVADIIIGRSGCGGGGASNAANVSPGAGGAAGLYGFGAGGGGGGAGTSGGTGVAKTGGHGGASALLITEW